MPGIRFALLQWARQEELQKKRKEDLQEARNQGRAGTIAVIKARIEAMHGKVLNRAFALHQESSQLRMRVDQKQAEVDRALAFGPSKETAALIQQASKLRAEADRMLEEACSLASEAAGISMVLELIESGKF